MALHTSVINFGDASINKGASLLEGRAVYALLDGSSPASVSAMVRPRINQVSPCILTDRVAGYAEELASSNSNVATLIHKNHINIGLNKIAYEDYGADLKTGMITAQRPASSHTSSFWDGSFRSISLTINYGL